MPPQRRPSTSIGTLMSEVFSNWVRISSEAGSMSGSSTEEKCGRPVSAISRSRG